MFSVKKIILGVALLGLVGCSTTPQTFQVDKSRLMSQSFDDSWAKTVRFFASNSIDVKTIEKDSGVIFAETQRSGLSKAETKSGDIVIDGLVVGSCGKSLLAPPSNRVIKFNVFMVPQVSKTKVTVNTTMIENRLRSDGFSTSNVTVACNSSGAFEKALLDYIQN